MKDGDELSQIDKIKEFSITDLLNFIRKIEESFKFLINKDPNLERRFSRVRENSMVL